MTPEIVDHLERAALAAWTFARLAHHPPTRRHRVNNALRIERCLTHQRIELRQGAAAPRPPVGSQPAQQ